MSPRPARGSGGRPGRAARTLSRVTAAREVQSTSARPPAAATRPATSSAAASAQPGSRRLGQVAWRRRASPAPGSRTATRPRGPTYPRPGSGRRRPVVVASGVRRRRPATARDRAERRPRDRARAGGRTARSGCRRRASPTRGRPGRSAEQALGERLGDADRREVQRRRPRATRPRPRAGVWSRRSASSRDAASCCDLRRPRSGRRRRRSPRCAVGEPLGRDAERGGERAVGRVDPAVERLERAARARRRPRRRGRCRPGRRRRVPEPGRELAEADGGEVEAERAGGDVGERVRLVEHHDVVLGQHVAGRREVRAVERVVDDEDVRAGRRARGPARRSTPRRRCTSPRPGTRGARSSRPGARRRRCRRRRGRRWSDSTAKRSRRSRSRASVGPGRSSSSGCPSSAARSFARHTYCERPFSSAAVNGTPPCSRRWGRSLCQSWSCSVSVAVDTTTCWPDVTAGGEVREPLARSGGRLGDEVVAGASIASADRGREPVLARPVVAAERRDRGRAAPSRGVEPRFRAGSRGSGGSRCSRSSLAPAPVEGTWRWDRRAQTPSDITQRRIRTNLLRERSRKNPRKIRRFGGPSCKADHHNPVRSSKESQ